MATPDPSILELMRCPVSHSKLTLLDKQPLAELNNQIAGGGVTDRAGRTIVDQIEHGLVNADGNFVYSVQGGITKLIADEAIVLAPSS